MNVIEDGDIASAKWFLERRVKEDYSLKVEQEVKAEVTEIVDFSTLSDEELRRIIE